MSELVWQKSSFSGSDAGQECVEIAAPHTRETLLLRESDSPERVVRTAPAALRALMAALHEPGTPLR
ncbi:DUF397 domain-containing protein [Streptomyces sp. NBC_00237]|uniref:DUF397 domain-containing protein n=1 Tax=Streptomyces sp. NBC_00237 TaxID=2975687 RepID=UPI002251DCCF|nr:DUF397 domain-containing protein [Streptomyces sp. NBC_00237]MCX5200805.1 DUF397 domain-containing protein [Streptomyces sp. NBC_00237]